MENLGFSQQDISLLNGIVQLATLAYVAYINRRVGKVGTDVTKVQLNTDGINAALLKKTAEDSKHEGIGLGRNQVNAEQNVDRQRNEPTTR
jgi:hypothetical protein